MVKKRKAERYEIDPDDGLPRGIVGDWASDKHRRLKHYVDITHRTRRIFLEDYGREVCYIDLYCGPGRARVQDTDDIQPGSALIAAQEAMRHFAFSALHIGDADRETMEACRARLLAAGAKNVVGYIGPAEVTAQEVVTNVDPNSLHLVFLDPFSLHALPFDVLRTLARLKRADLLIHFSWMDLQRNIVAMCENGQLERIVPGWKAAADPSRKSRDSVLAAVFSRWCDNLQQLGFRVSSNALRVKGPNDAELYRLVLASRHELADRFWASISNEPQRSWNF